MNYSNTIVIFVLLTSTIICQNKNYTNEDLGLSFSYINRENSPFTLQYIDSCITRDSIIWQNFESINLRLRLKYPKTLRLKDEWIDNRIQLGYKNYVDDTEYYQVITIYKSGMNFIDIVKEHNFIRDNNNPSKWINIGGEQGTSAFYFEGFNLKGLRGSSRRRVYTCEEGGYAGYIEYYLTVLVFDNNVVLTFYGGPLEKCADEYGVPKSQICENIFFSIASSIQLIEN